MKSVQHNIIKLAIHVEFGGSLNCRSVLFPPLIPFFLSSSHTWSRVSCVIIQGTNSEAEQFSALLFCNPSLLLSHSGAPIDKIYSVVWKIASIASSLPFFGLVRISCGVWLACTNNFCVVGRWMASLFMCFISFFCTGLFFSCTCTTNKYLQKKKLNNMHPFGLWSEATSVIALKR